MICSHFIFYSSISKPICWCFFQLNSNKTWIFFLLVPISRMDNVIIRYQLKMCAQNMYCDYLFWQNVNGYIHTCIHTQINAEKKIRTWWSLATSHQNNGYCRFDWSLSFVFVDTFIFVHVIAFCHWNEWHFDS